MSLPPPRHRQLLEALAATEEGDRRLAAVHALAAAGWCFFLVVSRSIEAGFFVALCVLSIWRIKDSWRCGRALLATGPARCVAAWLVVVVAATLLANPPAEWTLAVPRRQFLVPILLVPVLHRWRLLLAGLVIGSGVNAAISLVESLVLVARGEDLIRAALERASFVAPLALVAGLAAVASRGVGPRLAGVALLVLSGGALATSSQRAILLAAAVGGLVIMLLGLAGRGWRTWLVIGASSALLAAGVVGISLALGGAVGKGLGTGFNAWTGSRECMWRATIEVGLDRPWFGHGLGAWRETILSLQDAEPERFACLQAVADHAEVGYAHNLLIDLLFETGVVGVGLWLMALALGLRAAWSRLRREPMLPMALGMLAATIAAAQFDHALARGIPSALLLLLGLLVLVPRPDQDALASRGLGREDDWLDGWLGGASWRGATERTEGPAGSSA